VTIVRAMRSRLAVAAALALSAALAACGPGTTGDVTSIRHVITAFSASSGPNACNYLTTGALNELYLANGHATQDRAKSLAACAAKARYFKGAPVQIGRIWFPHDSRTASAFAHAPGGSPRWQLFLHKVGNDWQIAHIQH
jgi:hypothetical protein